MGAISHEKVFAITKAYEAYLDNKEHDHDAAQIARIRVPNDMISFLKKGRNGITFAQQGLQYCEELFSSKSQVLQGNIVFNLNEVKLAPPVTNPSKIVCIGKAYMSHVQETDRVIPPDVMVAFHKAPTTLIGHRQPIVAKDLSQDLDYEIELAIVIGKEAMDVKEEEAFDYVAGFTIMNDVSYRSPKGENSRISPVAKSPDTFGPLGPWIVTLDEIENPMNLRLRSFVNQAPRQDAKTSDLLWNLKRMISFTTSFMTLIPGDILSTGTPGGNGIRDGNFLKAGDTVRCEIEGIGVLENTVSTK